MNFVAVFMLIFAILGGIDLIFGNRLGIGKEFERGFHLLGTICLSMIGMIVLAPLIGEIIKPLFDFIYNTFNIDPSVIPAMVFANDMGGAPLAKEISRSDTIGMFNALIVSSMMGCTISFTLPYAINAVKKEQQDNMLLGFLCGIMTIPVGCFVAGLMLKINIFTLLYNMLPLIVFSIIVVIGLILFPKQSIKIFNIIGNILKIMIIVGLLLGLIQFLTGFEVIKGLASFEEAAMICFNAAAVMSGALPFLFILSKVLSKPLKTLGAKLNINEVSALGFISTLANNVTTFEAMKDMDDKGVVLNSAFCISAGFVIAGHLAFTMVFDTNYITPMIVGKLISGIFAVLAAFIIYERNH